jgi:outer membrane protein TolC
MKQFFAFLFIVFHGVVNSQDTLTELNLNQFLQHVKENHPVALIAQNNVALADQYVRLSKGAFDPVLMGGVDQKYFDGKTYYSTIGAGLKIPTRIGVDVKMMANWSRGVYLNNENTLPDQGLTAIGVEVPIGKGLLTDERRNQLKRAMLGTQQSVLEQQLTLNDLMYEAGQVFINWQEQEAQLVLALEGLALAETRYQQIYANVALGERADIDTVEAIAQLFLRQMEVDQRRLNAQNTRLVVENYLWEKGVLPLVLDDGIKPQPLVLIAPVPRLSDTLDQHPIVTWYDLKRKDLQLERQLKLEQLKPQLNVNYNLLQTPQNAAAFNYSLSNYKWGGTLYIPIFLRKERASLQMTTIKMANVAL